MSFDKIYLTGFKKFANVKVNPTELIVEELRKDPIKNVHLETLDVTVDEVDKYIKSIKKITSDNKKAKTLHLHFGVGPNKIYNLESCCYNMKDFRVPDNSGKQCQKEQICKNLALDEALKTDLDLPFLAQKLGKKHDVEISTDPGRYLCNYVYFSSMNELKNSAEVDCLFVHFPDQKVKSHEENIKFVKDLIKLLLKSKE